MAQAALSTLRPSEFDDIIRQAGVDDERQGFCGPAWTWDELVWQGRQFRLIKRFCIKQPSGKRRAIDDAASGGQPADC